MMKKLSFLVFIGLIISFASCSKNDADINQPLAINLPASFPKQIYSFAENPMTQQGFELGKMLFYDPKLSADGTISCGSCHQQFSGFANLDHETSHGVDNCLGTRNTPVLFNMIWKDNLFLDGGVVNLELAPVNAITDQCEMKNDIASILAYLKSEIKYQKQFKKAFDSDEINSQKMLKALAQFMAAMISDNSKYDQVKAGKTTFNTAEATGYQLFVQKCSTCHTEPLFSDNSFRNNGLDTSSSDLGRAKITELITDEGKFKVPTLRNIEVSRPYMHDGRFSTLEQVLDHYQNNIKANKNLDPLLVQNLNLTNTDKTNIVAFLKTLTDQTFLKNPKFSEN